MKELTPVALPPGWARLATRPSLTGSSLTPKTIGIVWVAVVATRATAAQAPRSRSLAGGPDQPPSPHADRSYLRAQRSAFKARHKIKGRLLLGRQPVARQRLRIILLTGRRVRSGGVNGRYVPVNQTVRTHTACIWVDLDDQARRLVRTFEGLVVLKFAVSKKPVA